MWKSRIGWISIVLASVILYLFANGTETLTFLVLCIAAPLMSGLLLMAAGRNITVSIDKEEKTSGTAAIEVTIKNPGILPLPMAVLDVHSYNRRTEEQRTDELAAGLPSRSTVRKRFEIPSAHTGIYDIRSGQLTMTDALRLWSKKISTHAETGLEVMPNRFDIRVSVGSSASAMPESERYAEARAGNDPGEVRSIREYIPGDPVRNIHWKLSEKTDKLLIKELGLPVTEQFLVILDTSLGYRLPGEVLDAIASVYDSLVRALLLEKKEFTMAWTDPEAHILAMRHIQSEADITDSERLFLGVPASSQSMIGSLRPDDPQNRYAHIVVVGSEIPQSIESVANGCVVTLLLHGHADGMSGADGMKIIGFDHIGYEDKLAEIEV